MISPVKIWRRQKEIRKLLGKKGTIITWTKIHMAGVEFKKFAPYPVVIVEFATGEKITAQLVNYDKKELRIGQKVVVVLRKAREGSDEDILAYGLKLKPFS